MDIGKYERELDRVMPPVPIVKFTLSREKTDVYDSKLGGVPYMPKGFPYPKGISGEYRDRPLRLLAQLNLEKLPHTEPFPENGILQFFIADDDMRGLGFEDQYYQNGFRVIYHENIITDERELLSADDMPTFTGEMPFDEEFLLKTSEAAVCRGTGADFRAEEILEKAEKELDTDSLDELSDHFWGDLANESTCMGGYPFFTQYDPRENMEDDGNLPLIMLFQSASDYGDGYVNVMWGDGGVANFFISERDLRDRNFSKVLYNWDCG